ncbi:DEKNAAC100058 [Brettanomyces naardenensis]|uniref:Structural maintenance of chromosomes protein n=1 Tax=Brettanomyces naardenensis TaxID=13370 RepID=A0A448YG39_BRENA|nr:DEKNAAC100058 [Brettanomyces naardenensis]
MYIKRITIQGFKSFKNECVIDSFSPHHNVVVGRNGSGKSNFFAAIRFVLSDAYTSMNREERQSLLYEGSGTVMSAYVEILFDNKDHRLPIDKDEVAIRRTIGMKKDDYSLNSRSASKSDIMNLLESAGFSRSNPYYIVPQGRVTAITNSKDEEKLELLKEVAGANVFETKLKDSNREMNSANKKQEQIDEMLNYIDTRLSDLSMEKESLRGFEKYNDKKKVLEFNLLDREMKSLTQQIDLIENEYSDSLEESNTVVQELNKREKSIRRLQSNLAELRSNLKLVRIDKQENGTEIEDILVKIGETKARIKTLELEEASASGEAALRLEETRQSIEEKEAELEELRPRRQSLEENEEKLKDQLKKSQLDQRSLLSKRGRNDQFSSKTARDEWLTREIGGLTESLKSKREELKSLKISQDEALAKIEVKRTEKDKASDFKDLETEISKAEKDLFDMKLNCSSLIDERKQLWREESKLNTIIESYKDEKSKAREDLSETMDSSISKGLDAVQNISDRLGLSGVYGSLGELIDVSDKYKTAVEVVGGNSLFYVVVNNDQTASLIMEQLIAEKAGRVTFMPLNRLHVKNVQYPNGNDSVPLIKKIAYEEYLEPAVRQIFGNTVVSISLEKGAEIAKSHNLNSVTLDGDRCSNNGVLSGGFREHTKSRVDCLKSINKWNSEASLVKEKLLIVKEQIEAKDSEITQINEVINEKKRDLEVLVERKESKEASISMAENELATAEQELGTYDSRVGSFNIAISLMEKQVNEYTSELHSEFNSSSLSPEEEILLDKLKTAIPELQNEYTDCSNELDTLDLRYSALKSELNEKLHPLENRLAKVASRSVGRNSSTNFKLEDLKRQIQVYERTQDQLKEAGNSLAETLDSLDAQIIDVEDEVKKSDEAQKALIRRLGNYSKNSEKSLSKKLSLRNRRDDINKKIKDLGLLPDNAFTEYTGSSSADILKELNVANDQLKQYGHVNKKALEQYLSFNKQRDSLVARRKELDKAKDSIEELVSVLQRRKNDAIIQTFKEVSSNFTRIFEKLVPAGTGRLIIQKRSEKAVESLTQLQPNDSDGEMQDLDDDDSAHTQTSSYVGVSIGVSFGSKNDEQLRIEQLSGGQKSLCALALILAIQSCDPAPFYLFDEIDANLDAQYRTSVANLIHELSRDAQFICTTFRPEMLNVSDAFFGVTFSNKVSTVTEIDKEEALNFVEAMQANS